MLKEHGASDSIRSGEALIKRDAGEDFVNRG
jgi:hypothetical protein